MSTYLKTIRRCIERGITLARAGELFRPTVLSVLIFATLWRVLVILRRMNSCQISCVQYSVLHSLLCILFAFKINLNIQQEPVWTSKIQQKLFSGRGKNPTPTFGPSALRCGPLGLASPLPNYPPHFQIHSDATGWLLSKPLTNSYCTSVSHANFDYPPFSSLAQKDGSHWGPSHDYILGVVKLLIQLVYCICPRLKKGIKLRCEIFHILKINRIMPFCNLFVGQPSCYEVMLSVVCI